MTTFEFNPENNELTCNMEGRMSADVTVEVAQTIENKMAEMIDSLPDRAGLKVNFNLAKVDYIASSFIRICVATAKQLQQGNFRISETSPLIKKTFKIAGLEELLNVS